jgi:hypothetical protein
MTVKPLPKSSSHSIPFNNPCKPAFCFYHVIIRILPFLLRNLNAYEEPNPLSPTYITHHLLASISSDLTSLATTLCRHLFASYLSHPTTQVHFPHQGISSPNASTMRNLLRSVLGPVPQQSAYSPVHVTYRVSSESLTNENIHQQFNI